MRIEDFPLTKIRNLNNRLKIDISVSNVLLNRIVTAVDRLSQWVMQWRISPVSFIIALCFFLSYKANAIGLKEPIAEMNQFSGCDAPLS